MLRKLFILSFSFSIFSFQSASALNSSEVSKMIQEKKPTEKIGYQIAKESELRDKGFQSFEVDMKMVLENAQGQRSERNMKNYTLEVPQENIGDKSMIVFSSPRDVRGTALLTHAKILNDDDQWLYLPALKRVKRISSRNKSGSFVGSEFAYEDFSSQEVDKFKYNYLEEDKCPQKQSEMCYKVERYPLYKNSGYTKQIAWYDKQDFLVRKVDYYDRKNSLLKTLNLKNYKKHNSKYWRAGEMEMKNHQTNKNTTLLWQKYDFRANLSDSYFISSRLKRVRIR